MRTTASRSRQSNFLPPYIYESVATKTFGVIWLKRSNTPCAPKSGEQEEKIAPIEALASIVSTTSIAFGNQATTRSPSTTPRLCSALARLATRWRNSSHVREVRFPVSSIATKASPEPVRFRKFSTMLSLASGKNCAATNCADGSFGISGL